MSDPIGAASSWLADTLDDTHLGALLPGGLHEMDAVINPAVSRELSFPVAVIDWGRATPFHTFASEDMWTVVFTVSVLTGPGQAASSSSAAVSRIHHLLTSQKTTPTFRGILRTQAGRTLFASPITGKTEATSEYRLHLHTPAS